MNTPDARSLLTEYLAGYRSRPYAELATWAGEGHIETLECAGPGGARYQIEVQFLWDDKPDGNVRVLGSIDDGGLRAFIPLTDSFVANAMEDSPSSPTPGRG